MERRTLRYETGQRSCLSGYQTPPEYPTGLSWDLPSLPAVSYRNVSAWGRRLLLWSPNSSQIPFLPGIPPPNLARSVPISSREGRYDGSYGRFDPTVNAKIVNIARPYWPFIRRENQVPNGDPRVVAFRPLVHEWNDEGLYSQRGSFNPSLIHSLQESRRSLETQMMEYRSSFRPDSTTWASRPQVTAAQIFDLAQVQRWERAVDYGVAVQRVLKEMEAWVTWRRAVKEQEAMTSEELSRSISAANDSWLGCWINGISEGYGLNFLAAGVPCFVVHEYEFDEEVLPGHELSNLLQGTNVERSLSDSNPYQAIARRQGLLDTLVMNDPSGVAPSVSSEDRQRSSLEYQRRRVKEKESARNRQRENPVEEGSIAAEGSTVHSVVQPIVWVEPPPVQSASRKGKWDKFELDDVGGRLGWIFRGKNYDVESSNEWFDCVRKRRLFMGPIVHPKGVFDVEVFGAPVPDFPFWFPGDGRGFLPAPKSLWMYQRAEPRAGDVGRRAEPPPARDQEVDDEQTIKMDKGKGKAEQSCGEEDELEGMEVDSPRVEDIPSPIVVLGNVEEGLSAISFHIATSPFLQTMRSFPVAITRTKGKMWIRLPNVEEAQRAYGVFLARGPACHSHNLTVEYSTLGDFEDTWAHSGDRWDINTLQDANIDADPMTAEETHQSEKEESSYEIQESVVAQPAFIGVTAADADLISFPPVHTPRTVKAQTSTQQMPASTSFSQDFTETSHSTLEEGTLAAHVAMTTGNYWDEEETIPLFAWFGEDFPEDMEDEQKRE
ncbi:hypothetical protein FB45DRAFT_1019487 [Roridomyces roridus]|uniref:Uncharacterized protein n=1 Tax=Roridomyces roridus TaxID=1738132 RepID=A0AAD7CF05_9AGAR|nr:hypothetical protein FB45DRAFT_1019487 [Roridomyces roridus]